MPQDHLKDYDTQELRFETTALTNSILIDLHEHCLNDIHLIDDDALNAAALFTASLLYQSMSDRVNQSLYHAEAARICGVITEHMERELPYIVQKLQEIRENDSPVLEELADGQPASQVRRKHTP